MKDAVGATIIIVTASMLASGAIPPPGGSNFLIMGTATGSGRFAYEPVLRYAEALLTKPPATPSLLPPAQSEEDLRPLAQAWITPELIAQTQAVWSPCAGRPLTRAEAVEIMTNTKEYLEMMFHLEDEFARDQETSA
jgi:hypothetical protein